jgi:6-phosphofructokinase
MFGILTGGGDAPGLNAVIISYARTLLNGGHTVVGLKRGWESVVQNGGIPESHYIQIDQALLATEEFKNKHREGGTFLESSRTNPQNLEGEDKTDVALENIVSFEFEDSRGFDGLVALGGEDTNEGANIIFQKSKRAPQDGERRKVPIIITGPKTVDKDVAETRWTIGSETAIEVAAQSLDNLDKTSSSHYRIYPQEIMGRKAGFLVLGAAVYNSLKYRDPEKQGHGFRALIPELFKYDLDTESFPLMGSQMDIDLIGQILLHDAIEYGNAIIGMSEGIEFGLDGKLYAIQKGALSRNDGYGHVQLTGSQRTKDLVDYWNEQFKRLANGNGSGPMTLRYGQLPVMKYQDLGYLARGADPNATDLYFSTLLGRTLAGWAMTGSNNGHMAALEEVKTTGFEYKFIPVPLSEVGGKATNLELTFGNLNEVIGLNPKDRVNFLRPTKVFADYVTRLSGYVSLKLKQRQSYDEGVASGAILL